MRLFFDEEFNTKELEKKINDDFFDVAIYKYFMMIVSEDTSEYLLKSKKKLLAREIEPFELFDVLMDCYHDENNEVEKKEDERVTELFKKRIAEIFEKVLADSEMTKTK